MPWILLLLCIVGGVATSEPEVNEAEVFAKGDLSLIVMGDPQYHFMCEVSNPPCREASRRCREAAARPAPQRAKSGQGNAPHPTGADCVALESRYANRVQRKAIEAYIRYQRYEPRALIIDGDLTDYGHRPQLDEFKTGWLRSFPIPILPGLGNHDYQNNVNDCALNVCARNMLNWFVSYARTASLPIEFNATSHTGSLAYSKSLCDYSGTTNCATIIQLNNAIDYEVEFNAFLIENWKIRSALEFLKAELARLATSKSPILINVHQNEDAREEKLKQLIGDWIYENRHNGFRPKIGVFFAHMHARHEVKTHCFHGVSVPFVYVGSVPNNRFTVLKFGKDGSNDTLSGFAARESGPLLLDTLPNLWSGPCNRSFVHYFHDASVRFNPLDG